MDSFQEHRVASSLDGSEEPFLLWLPPEGKPSALAVGLHSWSADRFNQQKSMLPFVSERGWALLLPEFRGPNLTRNPRVRQAGGSDLARRDIVDATRHVLRTHFEEKAPVFLLGGSGGGHMSLMVAGREDFQWTAVSSWCPITDLAAWQQENAGYRPHIEAVCGGAPGDSPEVDHDYRDRSPIHSAAQLAQCRLQLAHGRADRSVPYTHSWKMAQAIESHQPREFFFSIFDGAHELHHAEAFKFFDGTLNRTEAAQITR